MKATVERYDVYDKKDRFMGGYSTLLNRPNMPSALEMARMNLKQSQGKIIAVYDTGLEEEIVNLQVINK